MDKIDKNPSKVQREKMNREASKKITHFLKKKPLAKGFRIDCLSSYFELGIGGYPFVINYSEIGFKDKLEHQFRRMDLIKYFEVNMFESCWQ